MRRTWNNGAWFQFCEVISVLCAISVCEEAIANRGFADGNDVGFAHIFNSPAQYEKAVREHNRDIAKLDQLIYSSPIFSDARGYL